MSRNLSAPSLCFHKPSAQYLCSWAVLGKPKYVYLGKDEEQARTEASSRQPMKPGRGAVMGRGSGGGNEGTGKP